MKKTTWNSDPDEWIFIVKTEADALNLAETGSVSIFGNDRIDNMLKDHALADRSVAIILGADEVWNRKAKDIARALHGTAATVKSFFLQEIDREFEGDTIAEFLAHCGLCGLSNTAILGAAECAREYTRSDTEIDFMYDEIFAQKRGERCTIPLSYWPRLSEYSKLIKPGTVTIIAGPPKVGKSLFVLSLVRQLHESKSKWIYLPLEDRKLDLQFRILGILAREYSMIDDTAETVQAREQALKAHKDTLAGWLPNIMENPRAVRIGSNGDPFVPPLPHTEVLSFIKKSATDGNRIILIDPLSQIEFNGKDRWKLEEEFIRQTVAWAAHYSCTVIIVAHTSKDHAQKGPIGLSSIQGSSMLTRLAQCVLILDAHEDMESEIYRAGGAREIATHNRTLYIAGARHARGTRYRIAFNQSPKSPTFDEIGIIAGAVKKNFRSKGNREDERKDLQ